jgi:hypothetical protein
MEKLAIKIENTSKNLKPIPTEFLHWKTESKTGIAA